MWSGKVNRTTADVAIGLEPGRSLDLGCGEGGDVLWFAHAGWQAMGVDISPTAVRRANEEAARVGRADRARCIAADLATWTTDERFDLVTASFFQSPVALDRSAILRRAAGQVERGGGEAEVRMGWHGTFGLGGGGGRRPGRGIRSGWAGWG